MTRFDIFDTIDELRRAGEPFCVATVVRTADATSAKAGAKAAITAAGQIIGHLGGACVQRAIRSSARAAIETGETRLIRVRPHDAETEAAEDVDLFGSGCPSGGTVDILIEAYARPPLIVIFGKSSIAEALAAHARMAGFRVGEPLGGDISHLDVAASDFVVIASQGDGDLPALRQALLSSAEHVAMVASKRKAETLKQRLSAESIEADRLARLTAPAGLDIGGYDPHEIAVSILAQIILWRGEKRAGRLDRTAAIDA